MKKEIVIIGSGVAATAFASKILDENPLTDIIILEAGPQLKMKDFALFQNYLISNKLPNDKDQIYDYYWDLPYGDRDTTGENVSVGKTVIPMNGARTFMYGGSTVHWGGWSFRMKPEDFRLYSNTGHGIDWPFSYDELEPYYCEAEHFIGVSGNSDDHVTPRSKPYPYKQFPFTLEDGLHIEAYKKLGISYSHLPIARHGISTSNAPHAPCQTTGLCKYCPFGARFVAANILDDMQTRYNYPNLEIKRNAVVEEIIMDSKSVAAGVKYFDKKTNTEQFIEGKYIIVASGGIESPKLLLRSLSPYWKNGVGNDNDLVGRNFISHPYFMYMATMQSNPLQLQPEMGFPTLVSRHFDSPEEQSKGKFILMNPPSSPKINIARAMQAGASREEIIEIINGQTNNFVKVKPKIQLQGILEVFSKHENKVSNMSKTNRFGLPQTMIDYSQDAGFDQRMQEIKAIANKIFEGMNAIDVTEEYPVSWRADHAACTTRMSNNPDLGVVDSNLKIHGVDNVYVCSNASFSSLGAVNPTLTLTALSLRLGDHFNQIKRTEANKKLVSSNLQM